ncbi:unnamed protein product, partial [Brassica oleracea var. botrytis]
ALQVSVYTALPELGRIEFKEAILSQLEDFPDDLIIRLHIFYLLQTRVINFVQKDIGQMFPKWEFDVEDTPAENIIKLMFVVKEDNPRPRKKARKEAPAEASEEAAAEASEEVITTVGGLTKEDIKTMFKDIADAMREGFGTCLKEIKCLSERVEAVEKKVGITTKRKGTSSQNTTSPPKPMLEPGLHLLCFLYIRTCCMDFIYSESVNGTNAGRKSLAEDKGPDVPEAVPAAMPADASSSKDKAPEPSLQWRFNFKDFKDSEPDQNGLGRRLPGEAWNYYAGTIPSFCQSNKVWGTDIDDIYAPVNFADIHWIAMWILIPKRHIFSKKYFAKANGKTMRDKVAVDIFQELPDTHEFENKDNDDNLGAYDG